MEYVPTAESVVTDYQLVTDDAGLEQVAADIRQAGCFSLRVLVDHSDALRAGIVGSRCPRAARSARYIRFVTPRGCTGPQLTTAAALAVLKPLLEDSAIEKIGHDLKTDALVLARHGVTLGGYGIDTMLASYLPRRHAFGASARGSGARASGPELLPRTPCADAAPKATPIADLPPDGTPTFAGERADLPLQLATRSRLDSRVRT